MDLRKARGNTVGFKWGMTERGSYKNPRILYDGTADSGDEGPSDMGWCDAFSWRRSRLCKVTY